MAQALGYHFLIPLSCWSFRLSLLLQVPLRESGRSTCCFNMAPKWRGARALADPNAPDAITTWIRRHCSGDAVKRKERDCAIRTPEERAAIRDANMERMHAEYQLSKDHALSTVHDEELGHQSPRGDAVSYTHLTLPTISSV